MDNRIIQANFSLIITQFIQIIQELEEIFGSLFITRAELSQSMADFWLVAVQRNLIGRTGAAPVRPHRRAQPGLLRIVR
jgi:hypothetical protein